MHEAGRGGPRGTNGRSVGDNGMRPGVLFRVGGLQHQDDGRQKAGHQPEEPNQQAAEDVDLVRIACDSDRGAPQDAHWLATSAALDFRNGLSLILEERLM